jgi:hypothetical protein
MTRDECKLPREVLYGNRRTGFDRGMNTFHTNDIALLKAIVIGRIHEDKRQNTEIHEVLPVNPCHALCDDQVFDPCCKFLGP